MTAARGADRREVGKRGLVTRRKFLDALLSAVMTEDWLDVSVVQLAAQVKSAPGTFYQNFPSLGAAFDELYASLVERGEPLPAQVEAIARTRALEQGLVFTYTPPASHIAAYVQRVPIVPAVQWTGQNAAAVKELLGERFRELAEDGREEPDASGELLDADGSRLWPVHTGWWLLAGPGEEVSLLSPAVFAARYRAATIEERMGASS
jgi:AcrR family transcriptional regulator